MPAIALATLTNQLRAFFRTASAGSVLLGIATFVALAWANSPVASAYHAVFEKTIHLGIGRAALTWPLRLWINDALMAVFFFVVGLEIKRELVGGELRTLRRAALPAIAALGGMIVPAGIYVLVNRDGPGGHGWGIPMATDIAFALGCIAVVKNRVPPPLVVFLTALAIFDDIGAVAVIALFYGHGFDIGAFAASVAIVGALIAVNRYRVRSAAVYATLGVLLWIAVLASGIHATIAGVVLGACVPAGDLLHRMEKAVHGFVAFGVVPLFALANAGLDIRALSVNELVSPIPLGVALGLFVGKQFGVLAFTWLAVRAGLAELPAGASYRQVYGVALLAGIGFTMSLFVAGLAFHHDRHMQDTATLGILLGSVASAIAGLVTLRWAPRNARS